MTENLSAFTTLEPWVEKYLETQTEKYWLKHLIEFETLDELLSNEIIATYARLGDFKNWRTDKTRTELYFESDSGSRYCMRSGCLKIGRILTVNQIPHFVSKQITCYPFKFDFPLIVT